MFGKISTKLKWDTKKDNVKKIECYQKGETLFFNVEKKPTDYSSRSLDRFESFA